MTWARVTYALWAFAALSALFLWIASRRGPRGARARTAQPATLLRDALDGRLWLRVAVLLAWVWLGVHAFAR